ncbi:MAG: hypothetical protein M3120_00595 [Pseudomonadota bacterium]|nr:hypothetical protein [Pseudomonadota bacterium]
MLHGLLIAGGLRDMLRREPVGSLVLTAVVLKLAWEQTFASCPAGKIAARCKVSVHAYLDGAVVGLRP